MTYLLSAPLQQAVYGCLANDPAIVGVVGNAVFDAPPEGVRPPVFIAIGPEDVVQRFDKTNNAAAHRFTITLVSEAPGFLALKELAGLVEAALVNATLPLNRGRVVSITFQKAKARRERSGTRRRIDMTFRAFVDDE